MLMLTGAPTGSANAVVSRRQVRAGSIVKLESRISIEGGNEKDRRNDSMLSKSRSATKLRGRRGSRCNRCALFDEAWERVGSVNRPSIKSSELSNRGDVL
jgi:hypothetical protein